MSNLIDLNEIRKEFEKKLSKEEWVQFAEMQKIIADKYEKQIQFLIEKNKHLENLLLNNQRDFLSELTPEETICIQQISFLENSSQQRPLTLEEVKRLDLLVKNLKLIREESTIVVNSRSSAKLEEKDLVAIVKAEIEGSITERS